MPSPLKMKTVQLFGILVLYTTAVLGVFVQDAFVKDWIKHHYGQLEKYELVANDTLIATTDLNELVSLDPNAASKLRWSVDLKVLPSDIDDFVVLLRGDIIYGISSTGSCVYAWDLKSGVLINIYQLGGSIVKYESFFNRDLIALDTSGKLQILHHDGSLTSHESSHVITDFKVSSFNGAAYVLLDNDSFLSIGADGKLEILTEYVPPPFSKVKAFKEGIIITTDNKLVQFDNLDSPVAIPYKLNKVVIINSEFFIGYSGKLFNVYNYIDGEFSQVWSNTLDKVIEDVDAIEYSLTSLVSVATSADSIIYDFTDFITTQDPETISKIQFPAVFNKDTRIILSESELELVTAFFYEPATLLLKKYSLQRETISELSVDLELLHSSGPSKAILVNKPHSQTAIDKAHHIIEDAYSFSVFSSWLSRTRRHLSEIGKFVFLLIDTYSEEPQQVPVIKEDIYGFGKVLVYVDEAHQALVATDTSNAKELQTLFFPFDGEVKDLLHANSHIYVVFEKSVVIVDIRDWSLRVKDFNKPIAHVFLTEVELPDNEYAIEDDEIPGVVYALILEASDEIELLDSNNNLKLRESQYFVERKGENELGGFKLVGNKLISTWRFTKSSEAILLTAQKPLDHVTSSVGIARFDKSVIYKYLNPNLISLITQDVVTKQLNLYLIDGVTGTLLYTQKHQEEVVDPESINLIQDDNWIIYTYFIKSPSLEQRIIVVDLFDTAENAVTNNKEKSVFGKENRFNITIDSISKKSYIFPEKIITIKPTYTKFGITLKSIIALTETGSLFELPKFILNSRRIDDRAVTQEDLQDEFRIMPYEPVIFKNTYQTLNHKNKLTVDDKYNQIVIKSTELESTSVVCFVNKYNEFCTLIQPSLSYDLLNSNFDKIKLSITIVILLVAYLVTKPFVLSKKLNAAWQDR